MYHRHSNWFGYTRFNHSYVKDESVHSLDGTHNIKSRQPNAELLT